MRQRSTAWRWGGDRTSVDQRAGRCWPRARHAACSAGDSARAGGVLAWARGASAASACVRACRATSQACASAAATWRCAGSTWRHGRAHEAAAARSRSRGGAWAFALRSAWGGRFARACASTARSTGERAWTNASTPRVSTGSAALYGHTGVRDGCRRACQRERVPPCSCPTIVWPHAPQETSPCQSAWPGRGRPRVVCRSSSA